MQSAGSEGVVQSRLQMLHIHVLLVAHWVPAPRIRLTDTF